jgi:hypothetical protein
MALPGQAAAAVTLTIQQRKFSKEGFASTGAPAVAVGSVGRAAGRLGACSLRARALASHLAAHQPG